MKCNNDKACLNIANDYTEKIENLKNNFNILESDYTDINSEIKKIEIPNDYLGKKVQELIIKINDSNTETSNLIEESKTETIEFATKMKNMHQNHYNDWKRKNSDNYLNNSKEQQYFLFK